MTCVILDFTVLGDNHHHILAILPVLQGISVWLAAAIKLDVLLGNISQTGRHLVAYSVQKPIIVIPMKQVVQLITILHWYAHQK